MLITDISKSLGRAIRTDGLAPTRLGFPFAVDSRASHSRSQSELLRLTTNSKLYDFRRHTVLTPPEMLALCGPHVRIFFEFSC